MRMIYGNSLLVYFLQEKFVSFRIRLIVKFNSGRLSSQLPVANCKPRNINRIAEGKYFYPEDSLSSLLFIILGVNSLNYWIVCPEVLFLLKPR